MITLLDRSGDRQIPFNDLDTTWKETVALKTHTALRLEKTGNIGQRKGTRIDNPKDIQPHDDVLIMPNLQAG